MAKLGRGDGGDEGLWGGRSVVAGDAGVPEGVATKRGCMYVSMCMYIYIYIYIYT